MRRTGYQNKPKPGRWLLTVCFATNVVNKMRLFITNILFLLAISANVVFSPVVFGQKETDWPRYVKSASGRVSELIHKTFEFSAMLATNQPSGGGFPPCIVPSRYVRFFITDTNVPATSFGVAFDYVGRLVNSGGGTFPLLTNLQAGETYRLTVDATWVGSGNQKGLLHGVLKDISRLPGAKVPPLATKQTEATLDDANQAISELRVDMSETDTLAILRKHGIAPSGRGLGRDTWKMGCKLSDKNCQLVLTFRFVSQDMRDKGPSELTGWKILDSSGKTRLAPKKDYPIRLRPTTAGQVTLTGQQNGGQEERRRMLARRFATSMAEICWLNR